jgi:hypothetical protein
MQQQLDHGFAFLFIYSNNPVWHPTIIYSFNEQFKESVIYLGNGPTPLGRDWAKKDLLGEEGLCL